MARMRGPQIYSTDVLEEFRKAMEEETTAEADDQTRFKVKVTALERFLNHGLSRFSLQDCHLALTSLFQSYQQALAEHPEDRAITRVKSVAQLRLISRYLLLQPKSLLGVDIIHALKYLDNFLTALEYLKEAKECLDSLFQFLYQSFYDPPEEQNSVGREVSMTTSQKLSIDLESCPCVSPVEEKFHHDLSSKYGIQTPEQMSGSAAHKLHLTVLDMKDIMARWTQLQGEEEISPDDLDPESHQELQLLQGTSAFEPVLRLMPDMFAKFYKCLELAKQWWLLAHQIYPVLPRHRCQATCASRAGTPVGEGSDGGCKPTVVAPSEVSKEDITLQETLLSVSEEVLNTENMLITYRHDLQLLMNRERHFESLVETYERVSTQLDDKVRERRALAAVRECDAHSTTANMIVMSNGQSDRSSERKLQSAREENGDKHLLDALDREIQLLQFQHDLLLQDYLVQLELRPSLIRFTDELRMKTCEAKNHLAKKAAEKHRLEQYMIASGQGKNPLSMMSSLHVGIKAELSDLISGHDFGISGKGNDHEASENGRADQQQVSGDDAVENSVEPAGFQPVRDNSRCKERKSRKSSLHT